MSEVRLVIRDAERDWSGTIHGSCADCAVAALSADPVTMDELEAAVARFDGWLSSSGRYFVNLQPGSCAEPYDAGLVVIDLVARLVVVDSTYSSPGPQGGIWLRDDDGTDRVLSYHLADDWRFSVDGENWDHLTEQRRRERAAHSPLDARAVLYGRPMIEFIARAAFAEFARRAQIEAAARAEWADEARQRLAKESNILPDEVDPNLLTDELVTPKSWPGQERCASPFYGTLMEIHAAWLLTARDDLRGQSPREVMFQRRRHISADLGDRCAQWSLVGECPPGLDRSSHAFRYAGFGTHEMVKYYELVRALLWSCWERLGELSRLPNVAHRPESLMVGDFLTDEVPRLERARDVWLDTPEGDFHPRTPRSVIERERARLPEAVSGREAMIDPDCPCCQMMAESGPFFWHLDGCNLDDGFAFDIYHGTLEEWEAEQGEWAEFERRREAERAECERLGVASSQPREDGSNAAWTRSFSVGDTAGVPLGMRVFGIGCRLAELIVGLRDGADREHTSPDARRWIDQLNRDFGNLRDVLQSSDANLAEVLVAPVVGSFVDTLQSVATTCPDLADVCDGLADELDSLLDPPPPKPTWNACDDDVPF